MMSEQTSPDQILKECEKVSSEYRKEADQAITDLMSKVYLSDQSDYKKVVEIERSHIKAVLPYTTLDRQKGSAVLLHDIDKTGTHPTHLVDEKPEEVQSIMEGTPSEVMVHYWGTRLSEIYEHQHQEISERTHNKFKLAIHAVKKTERDNLKKNDNAYNPTELRYANIRLRKSLEKRGPVGEFFARLSGQAERENQTLAQQKAFIHTYEENEKNYKETAKEQRSTLLEERDKYLDKLRAQHEGNMAPEKRESDLANMTSAFKVTMMQHNIAEMEENAPDTAAIAEVKSEMEQAISEAKGTMDQKWIRLQRDAHTQPFEEEQPEDLSASYWGRGYPLRDFDYRGYEL